MEFVVIIQKKKKSSLVREGYCELVPVGALIRNKSDKAMFGDFA